MINLDSYPTVNGMYMPDAITTFRVGNTRCELLTFCRVTVVI